jgi:Protein of unknown function (DUF4238)
VTRKITRKSHLIPAFYLAGFTVDGGRGTQLHVLDQERRKRYASRPDELAIDSDAYLVDAEGIPPGIAEDALEKIESRAAPVLARMRSGHVLPSGDDLAAFVEFVATLAMRDQKSRESTNDVFAQLGRSIMAMGMANQESFGEMIKRAKAGGMRGVGEVSFEGMKSFLDRGDFKIAATSTTHAALLGVGADAIIPCLAERKWSMLVANAGEGDFVCSDHPVGLRWTDGIRGAYGPGFALRGTDVTIPIGRRVALVGRFEDGGQVGAVYRRRIAGVNSRTAGPGGCIYSATGDFWWIRSDGEICRSEMLMGDRGREHERGTP